MESPFSIQKTLLLVSTIFLSSCIHSQFWKKEDAQLGAIKTLWFAPIGGDGLAPGTEQSFRQLCLTDFRKKGYHVLLDSTQPKEAERAIKIQMSEFRYKRGLGEEPIVGLYVELTDLNKSEAMASMQLSADGAGIDFWNTQSLTRLSTLICSEISQQMLP